MYNLELPKPAKIAYNLNDECLDPQTIQKARVSLAAHIFGESAQSAITYYVKNGHPKWEFIFHIIRNFLKLIAKSRSLVKVKSVSKGTQKRDIDIDPLLFTT